MSALQAICFIGGGNMGSAIMAGIEAAGTPAASITVIDRAEEVLARHETHGRKIAHSIDAGLPGAKAVVMAVKPQVAQAVLAHVAAQWDADAVLISIMAGIPTATLEAALPAGARVVRVMPNTPMAIGQGMSAVCGGQHAREEDLQLAEAMCAACGSVIRVPEERFDAYTALAGSGPAFVFRYCEAMLAAAEAQGFSREDAAEIVGKTVEGSIRYARSQIDFPVSDLRVAVTSPGGTTAAGLEQFDHGNFDQLIAQVIAAATKRGQELAEQS